MKKRLKFRWNRGWLLASLLVLELCPPAYATDITIERFSLNNGLKVIVLPNHRVAAISHMLWFPSGGADDPYGKSGLAHYHEHMMFKGTPNHPAGEFEAIISRNGGDHNAFTSYDTTGYYVNIPKGALADIMQLEADRLRGITPSETDAVMERKVIIEERRVRIENNPDALLDEQLNAALWVHHPYGTPLIGWQHEMEQLSLADVLAFHQQHYHVGNATLLLSGDITAAEARPLVEQFYGPLEAATTPPRQWTDEPPARAAKRLTMHHSQVKEPTWQRRFAAPSTGSGQREDALPLMVYAHWLGNGQTSFLYQQLVANDKVATQIHAGYSPFSIGPAQFTITAVPAEGVSMQQLEAAIEKAVQSSLNSPISSADLARAKTLLKAETLYAREGLQGLAYMVGWLTMTGLDADYINQWPALIDAVTPAHMQTAARRVILSPHSVTGLLLPAGGAAHE